MLCEGKQHDMQRAAAFIKRLATFSLCFGHPEAMSGQSLCSLCCVKERMMHREIERERAEVRDGEKE